jgi:hypothetical protein
MKLDEELLGELAPELATAKEKGLGQEWFQGLVDKWAARQQRQAEAAATEAETAYREQQKTWVDGLKADPEFGQTQWAATRKLAGIGLMRAFGADVAEALKLTGLENHPAVVKGLARLGKLYSERPVERGGTVTAKERDAAGDMYPDMPRS